MGERKVSKIIYIIVALFLIFVMVKGLLESSNLSYKSISNNLIECYGGEFLPENEGKLVLITGTPSFDEEDALKDEEYNVEVKNAVILNRNSYQYRYYKEKDDSEAFKSDTDTNSKYYVTYGWVESNCQKEERLYEANDVYSNPESKLDSEKYLGSFNVGEFKLNSDIVNTNLLVENNYYGLRDGSNEILGNYHVIFEEGKEYLSNVVDNTIKIGDYRIGFTYYTFKYDQEYTFVGKQVGNTIQRYTEGTVNLYSAYEGNYSREELLTKLKKDFGDAKFGIVFCFIILFIVGLIVFRDNLENLIIKIREKKEIKKNNKKNNKK